MKEIITRKVGVDPGFSSLKVAEVRDDNIETVNLPATVGLGADTETGLSLVGVTRARTPTNHPIEITFDGSHYLVGHNVSLYTHPIRRMDFDRFTDSHELRASLYAALYRILNGGTHQLSLAIALPITVLARKSDAQRIERKIREWLIGNHHFVINGVETQLNVISLRAKIPQPVAGWFDWGMDTAGQWVKGADALRAPTLVIDQGFNTLDVLVVQNGQISQRYTGGDTLGMRRAAEQLMTILQKRYRIKPDLLDADALIRQLSTGQKVNTFVAGEAVDVTIPARQALGSLENDVARFLEQVNLSGEMYRVLLIGGGAMSLQSKLLTLFPNATLLPDATLANARGLAKLACRKGFLD